MRLLSLLLIVVILAGCSASAKYDIDMECNNSSGIGFDVCDPLQDECDEQTSTGL
jgi:hypothetical protein